MHSDIHHSEEPQVDMDQELNPDRIRWASTLNYVPIDRSISGDSDKIILPGSALEQLVNQAPSLPSPLCFKLTNTKTERFTHVGVREFSAPEGSVLVPDTVATSILGLKGGDGDQIKVDFVVLPKATSMKIKPVEDDYGVDDWKVMLEAQLNRTHTALTEGDSLFISNPLNRSKYFEFVIEHIEPAKAVCIVDTDVDLEITSTRSLEAGSNSSNGKSSVDSAPKELEIESTVSIKVNPQQLVKMEVTKWDKSSPVSILMNTSSDPSELGVYGFVGTSDQTSPQNYLWCTALSGEEMVIDPKSPFLDSKHGQLWVALWSEIDAVPLSITATAEAKGSQSPSEQPEIKKCENCRQLIPIQSYQLHSATCQRNNVRCGDCGRIFSRRDGGIPEHHWHCNEGHEKPLNGDSKFSLRQHNALCHTPISCQCGSAEVFPNQISMAQHRATTCALSLHTCRFCHLKVPREEASPVDVLEGLSGHESKCGSKTTDCFKCGKVVRLRELDSHIALHDIQQQSQSAPVLCANINCIRTVKAGSTNSLGLCGICFGPLHSTMHDPDGSKLRSRIERRYMIQLTRGCGRVSCMNQYCALGNPGGKKPIGEVAKLVKELIDRPGWFAFCVDEMTTKRMLFVESESSKGEYERSWCARAIEECKGSESDAQTWLVNNAVHK